MTTYDRVEAIFAKSDKSYDALVEVAGIIDNLTARLGAQVDLTIETEKQLGIVRATRDAYLRELGGLRDRLARADVGPRPTDERIADALEKMVVAMTVTFGVAEKIANMIGKFPVSKLP